MNDLNISISPNELIRGRYYCITYNENEVYTVMATSNDWVHVLMMNGESRTKSGSCFGAQSIIEITKEQAFGKTFSSNKEAAVLLKEKW